MLLAALDERRPTADVDLLAQAIANDADSISRVVRVVLGIAGDDGVTFARVISVGVGPPTPKQLFVLPQKNAGHHPVIIVRSDQEEELQAAGWSAESK